jgi:hypothetical protein
MKVDELKDQTKRVERGSAIQQTLQQIAQEYKVVSSAVWVCVASNEIRYSPSIDPPTIGYAVGGIPYEATKKMRDELRQILLNHLQSRIDALKAEFDAL